MVTFAPTLACADPLNLERDMKELLCGGAAMWHIDVMDGCYVPNICFGWEQTEAIAKRGELPVDLHLMTQQPEKWMDRLRALRPARAAFHVDATSFSIRLINWLREEKIRPGIALNPSQPVELLEEVLPLADYVLLMAVEPGFSGQKFLQSTYKKLQKLQDLRSARNLNFQIMVDGGIAADTGKRCVMLGADALVTGAFVWTNRPEGIAAACKNFAREMEEGLNETDCFGQ